VGMPFELIQIPVIFIINFGKQATGERDEFHSTSLFRQ
jgi:hypothetical protein